MKIWAENVAHMRAARNVYIILAGKSEAKAYFMTAGRRCDVNNKIYFKKHRP
jgi:hypothetical protein